MKLSGWAILVVLGGCGGSDFAASPLEMPEGGTTATTGSGTSGSGSTSSSTTGGMPVPMPCTALGNECSGDMYCDALACIGPGVCRPRPSAANAAARDWVCGCDDVSYWNAIYAASLGVTAPTKGKCRAPRACSAAQPCPGSVQCVATGCTMSSACLAFPSVTMCPADDVPSYKACDNSPGCLNECEALRSGRASTVTTLNCR